MVVMISGHGNIETAVRATKLGAFNFIEKPLSLEKVVLAVRNSLEYLRLESENRRLRAELEEKHQILGSSVPMKALRQQIALTAPTNGRVLIYGESGTGKELVARALHASSSRESMPFVEVNCAAIPEELIESEMFGHRKGSFTGASEDKVGQISEGQWRDVVSRRSGRHESEDAVESSARAGRAARGTAGLEHADHRGRSRDRGHK